MNDFKHHKDNGYYYFHKIAIFASLKELGYKTLEEYDLDRKKEKIRREKREIFIQSLLRKNEEMRKKFKLN